MVFTNFLREQTPRTFERRRMVGFIVNNDDSKHQDGNKIQRVQMRLPDIHDDIADADLPWFTPGALDAHSGGSDVGKHGPIPPNGARVYATFEDDSQYHGQYHGGVAHTDNQIGEFVKPQGTTGSNTQTPGDGNSAASGDDNSSTGDQATDLKQKTAYDFTKDYPNAHGEVNDSGDFHGHSTKADFTEHTAVSGTGWQRDGVGNMKFVVNGNVKRQDNSNAKALLPEGFTAAIFGNGTVYLSKNCTISVGGDATINATGGATVSAGKDASVVAGGKATVSCKGALALTSGADVVISAKGSAQINAANIRLNAGDIKSQVPVVQGTSGTIASPTDPTKVEAQTAPAPRSRPSQTAPANDESY